MFENNFLNQYGVDVKFEFESNTKDDNQDVSVIIANAFEKFVARQIL